MRRALLIGVSAPGLDVGLALERLSPLLLRAGFSFDLCVDAAATRSGILERLRALVRDCHPGDAYVIYYFGHGGRVRLPGEQPDADQVVGYVTCHAGAEPILDRELSDLATQLDAGCGNVTVILDCCYSGELVRAEGAPPTFKDGPDPEWVRAQLATPTLATLALDSHPRIVRLGGASPKQQAFALVRSGRNIGVLTEALIHTVEAAGEQWSRLTWAYVIHRVREYVFERLRFEGQWPVLAGPRERLLFSTDRAELPGTVAHVHRFDGRGYLRAGWLQGVTVGERWAVAALDLDAQLRARPLGEVVVESVERNRAVVSGFDASAQARGLPAFPLTDADPRARVQALLRTLEQHQGDGCPVTFSWSKVDGTQLAGVDASVHVGERVCILLSHDPHAPPGSWFVSVILIDPEGWPRLLNARMPEGIELHPGDREVIGRRAGRAEQGIELPGCSATAHATLLFLASRRPIELRHIVGAQALDEGDLLRFQGLAGSGTRTADPEPASACAWTRIDFTLLPFSSEHP
jgi:hypothetical protein